MILVSLSIKSFLSEGTIEINTPILLILGILAALSTFIVILNLLRKIQKSLTVLIPSQTKQLYRQILAPYRFWIVAIALLSIGDILLLVNPINIWLKLLEIFIGIGVAIVTIVTWYRIFNNFFNLYLLDIALKGKRKINSELLIVGKYLGSGFFALIIVFIFSQTHHLNLVGLIASLGVGGLAVAFAAQKTLEQLLGGIVIFIDRPFVLDDYIGLPDGTFGRVESIGLRSTKIRTSGKGTLVIVPNSSLSQANIENYSRVKKVITMIYLKFDRLLPEEEKALIRQVIIESTQDIFGIDPRNSEVTFKDTIEPDKNSPITTAQINLFVLGSGEVSMELRRQLLDIARQNISDKLKEYGISFALEDKMINVDSPITI
ncbi:MAG: mechanosensitive ion channel family protein [Prochloraceae cyanobacterium]